MLLLFVLFSEPYLVGLSLDNEIISSFVGANVWNNVHHTTVQPQSDWYLNSPVLTGADEGYDYFRSFSIKFIKYERQRLRYKEYSTISVTAHTSKDYDRQWVNLAAVIVYGDRFISQNQTGESPYTNLKVFSFRRFSMFFMLLEIYCHLKNCKI